MDSYEYTQISDKIWQLEDDDGVCCTLVRGDELAVLIDTGYGRRDLRGFIESVVSTPYRVINSHGHPDHIGGNAQFEEVYALKEEWDVIRHFSEKNREGALREICLNERLCLGGLHIKVIPLAGHTKGSIVFLVEEEKLLIAGDALNEGLWLFNYGALTMHQMHETIQAAMELDFDNYLCGHSRSVYPKQKLKAHLRNMETLTLNNCTKQNTIGFETYTSVYEDAAGRSEIVFTPDRLDG